MGMAVEVRTWGFELSTGQNAALNFGGLLQREWARSQRFYLPAQDVVPVPLDVQAFSEFMVRSPLGLAPAGSSTNSAVLLP